MSRHSNTWWERNLVSFTRDMFDCSLRNNAVTNIWSTQLKECLGEHAKNPGQEDCAEVFCCRFPARKNISSGGSVQRHLGRKKNINVIFVFCSTHSPDRVQFTLAVQPEPSDTNESRLVTNTSAASPDPFAVDSAVSNTDRSVNESFDAMTLTRANKAQISDSLPSVDEHMPTGYHDALFEAVGHVIEENVHYLHRWEDTEALKK